MTPGGLAASLHVALATMALRCWIDDYNTFAPHSSLGMLSPAEFRLEQQTVADTGCLTK